MALGLSFLVAGCGTIASGGQARLPVAVSPSDARVVVQDAKGPTVYDGRSPGELRLQRGHDYSVVVSRDGYEPARLRVSHGLNGWTVANLAWLLPPLMALGVTIDLVSGGFWNASPDRLNVTLAAQAKPKAPAPPAAPNDEWKELPATPTASGESILMVTTP